MDIEAKIDYPEHEKLSNRKEEHDTVCAFLEFIEDHGIFMGKYIENEEYNKMLRPVFECYTPDVMIAMYFKIDIKAMSEEKDKMLLKIREGRK